MMSLVIQRDDSAIPLVSELKVATHFFDRFFGLMGRKTYSPEQGLLFPSCSSVHMYFMRMPLDIVFLKTVNSKQYEVLSVHVSVPAWRPLPIANFRADAVLELASPHPNSSEIKKGDVLCIV
jgi:uncharacterized protein